MASLCQPHSSSVCSVPPTLEAHSIPGRSRRQAHLLHTNSSSMHIRPLGDGSWACAHNPALSISSAAGCVLTPRVIVSSWAASPRCYRPMIAGSDWSIAANTTPAHPLTWLDLCGGEQHPEGPAANPQLLHVAVGLLLSRPCRIRLRRGQGAHACKVGCPCRQPGCASSRHDATAAAPPPLCLTVNNTAAAHARHKPPSCRYLRPCPDSAGAPPSEGPQNTRQLRMHRRVPSAATPYPERVPLGRVHAHGQVAAAVGAVVQHPLPPLWIVKCARRHVSKADLQCGP